MWQSRIVLFHRVFEHITEYSAKLLLGAGLIHASWMHQILMHLHSAYEPHP